MVYQDILLRTFFFQSVLQKTGFEKTALEQNCKNTKKNNVALCQVTSFFDLRVPGPPAWEARGYPWDPRDGTHGIPWGGHGIPLGGPFEPMGPCGPGTWEPVGPLGPMGPRVPMGPRPLGPLGPMIPWGPMALGA